MDDLKSQYNDSKVTWQQKVVLISLYHSAMIIQNGNWKIRNTANYFGVSIGLISENIRLAKELDGGPKCKELMKCKTREDGLKLIERRQYPRHRIQSPLIKEIK